MVKKIMMNATLCRNSLAQKFTEFWLFSCFCDFDTLGALADLHNNYLFFNAFSHFFFNPLKKLK